VVFATATPFDTPRLMEATDITGANRNTVKVHLRRLTEMGHLVKHGAGRAV
jgi:predicted ArsR family transcriptional regulator